MFANVQVLGAIPENNGRRIKRNTLVLKSYAVEDLAVYIHNNSGEACTVYRDTIMKLPHKSKAKIYKRHGKHKGENYEEC